MRLTWREVMAANDERAGEAHDERAEGVDTDRDAGYVDFYSGGY